MIKKIVMENLTCVNCATKIEKRINNLDYVNNASFNFTNQIMTVDFNDDVNLDDALFQIKNIVNVLEDNVNTYYQNEKKQVKEVKFFIDYLPVVIGLIIFIVAFVMNDIIYLRFIHKPLPGWVKILYWIGYVFLSSRIIYSTIKAIIHKNFFSENTLMLIATLAAMYLGKFDESISVILLYSIGEFLQRKAVDRSKNEIGSLINLQVEYSNVIRDGAVVQITPDQIKIKDIIVIKNGERVPVDGIISKGNTSLNSSTLNGESRLTTVKEGDEVLSGNINVGNVIELEATKEYKDSTLAKIINLIENSTSNKSKNEIFITKFSKIYTPIVLVLAFALFIVPSFFYISQANFKEIVNKNIYKTAMFLVISCPCSLVLSIPLSYFAGIGKAAKNGILFKGSTYLQIMSDVKTIALDKTGTLTYGDFFVTEYTSDDVYKIAASVERYSNHPIAQSIYQQYKGELYSLTNVEEIPGYGVKACLDGKPVFVGNYRFLNNNGIIFNKVINKTGSLVYVAVDSKYYGVITIKDSLKETSIDTVRRLNKNYDTIMLTGDNEASANEIAKNLGGIEYYSELLPEDKLKKFNEIKDQGTAVYVGDGINDAPLLKEADIGVSIGDASDIAIDVADVIIIDGNISTLEKAFNIAKKTKIIVLENIIFSLAIKSIFLILASFGISTMFLSILADVGVTLIAIFNSLRIIYQNKYIEKKSVKNE